MSKSQEQLLTFLHRFGYNKWKIARECFVNVDTVVSWLNGARIPERHYDHLRCIEIHIKRNLSE